MIAKTRAFLPVKLAAVLVALACASLIAPALAAAEGAAPIAYEHESLAEWEKQLAEGQIAAVTVNKRVRSLRTSLKDGRYVLAHYKAKEGPKMTAAMDARHVPVSVLTSAEAAKEVKPAHHKLRYIVGGVLIVVIVVVVAVLLLRRRRMREE